MTLHELQLELDSIHTVLVSGKDFTTVKERSGYVLRTLDSLFAKPEEEPAEGTACRIRAMLNISEVDLRMGFTHDGMERCKQALELAQNKGHEKLYSRALQCMAGGYLVLSDFDSAETYLNRALESVEQLKEEIDAICIMGNLGVLAMMTSRYVDALQYHARALERSIDHSYQQGINSNTGNLAIIYEHIGNYSKALELNQKAIQNSEEAGNTEALSLNLGNMANVYLQLDDYSRALEYQFRALELDSAMNNLYGMERTYTNIAMTYQKQKKYAAAMEFYEKAWDCSRQVGTDNSKCIIMGNMGMLLNKLGQFDDALNQLQSALELAKDRQLVFPQSHWLLALGQLYASKDFAGYDVAIAESYLHQTIELTIDHGILGLQADAREALFRLYESSGRWQEAFQERERHDVVRAELHLEEAHKRSLQLDNEREYMEREKQLAAERAGREAMQQLLHNVLPPVIAQRILDGQDVSAEMLSNVSVLFADIVNFTQLASRISPQELVSGLNTIFTLFDELAEKYGLEKIKTIGDGYMVVAGAPLSREDHAQAIALMAIEMQHVVHEQRQFGDGVQLQIRIGIHSGDVVAGVIGKHKFTYDLWGDAVNTASRMESSGEPDRIHCSADFTRHLVAQSDAFRFKERGEVLIKGKGPMKTYFLEYN